MNKIVEYNDKKYELMGFTFEIDFDENGMNNEVLEIRDIETDETIKIADKKVIETLVNKDGVIG